MTRTQLHALWMVPSAAFAAAATWALRTFDPNQAGNPFVACVFHQLTGLYCPGCGGTRAMHALVHFDLERALSMNALPFVAAPLLLLLTARLQGWLPATSERWTRFVANPWFWAVLVGGFTVLRNLPWAPFNALAPG
jgi:hypothetical protein